jgi:3-dehydroquinate dehydratase II
VSRGERTRVLVLSGPNLAEIGRREPEIYGTESYRTIMEELVAVTRETHAVDCVARQSNHEGQLIDWIASAAEDGFAGIVFNPGALTHTSIALLDAVRGCGLPCIEVHLSNPEAREAFRRRSYVGRACLAKVAGFGKDSYLLAVRGLVAHLERAAARKAPHA